jgi:hypothetical protein
MLVPYKSKKAMKEEVGKPLRYKETSMFGPEYTANGTFAVAHRPSVDPGDGGREFFAAVTMVEGKIAKVE